MDVLAAWLKQIILVVLLATFVDLLLPNRSMQRYVKLVVSLFILVTILSPVMNLLGSNMNLRMLAASVEGWSIGGTLNDDYLRDSSHGETLHPRSDAVPTLSRVLSEGEELAAKRNAESLKLFESKMESMVKEQIESQHGITVKQADVRLSLDKDGGPVIEQLNVVIDLAPKQHAGEQMAEREPIKPIEPVEIRVQVGEEEKSLPAFLPETKASKESEAKRREVAEALAEQWDVDQRRVTVKVYDSSRA